MKENNMDLAKKEEIKTNSGNEVTLKNLQFSMLQTSFGSTIDYSLSPLAGEESMPGIE